MLDVMRAVKPIGLD